MLIELGNFSNGSRVNGFLKSDNILSDREIMGDAKFNYWKMGFGIFQKLKISSSDILITSLGVEYLRKDGLGDNFYFLQKNNNYQYNFSISFQRKVYQAWGIRFGGLLYYGPDDQLFTDEPDQGKFLPISVGGSLGLSYSIGEYGGYFFCDPGPFG